MNHITHLLDKWDKTKPVTVCRNFFWLVEQDGRKVFLTTLLHLKDVKYSTLNGKQIIRGTLCTVDEINSTPCKGDNLPYALVDNWKNQTSDFVDMDALDQDNPIIAIWREEND